MTVDIRERTYAWQDPTATLVAGTTQDGLALLRAIGAGTLPLPPIMNTLAIEPGAAEDGKASFMLDPQEFHLNPFGLVHGGVLAAMLDTAMGCAVHSLLPVAVGYVTSEMNVRFLRPALLSSGRLVCTGEVVHPGRSTMIASAQVVDADQRVIAIAGGLAASAAYAGIWAMAGPHSFFTTFPGFGQAWVAPLSPYNEHLVRDVGGLYVALMVFSGWAAVKGDTGALRVLGWAWLTFGLPHLAFHVTHRHGFSTIEWAASMTPLTVAALGAAILVMLRHDHGAAAGHPTPRKETSR